MLTLILFFFEASNIFAMAQGKEYVGRYRLEYKRVEGGRFVIYKDKNDNEVRGWMGCVGRVVNE